MELSLAPKDITKATAQAIKALSLVTDSSKIDEEIRQAIKEAKTGQLQASQRELAEETIPEGEDVASWSKKVQKLNNKLDKHIDASQGIGESLKQHAEYFQKLSESFRALAEAQE